MRLFDGIKLAADVVKSGIAAVKASDKLISLVDRSLTDYQDLLKPAQNKLRNAYTALLEKKESAVDDDEIKSLTQQTQAAAVAYLKSLESDDAFPKDFRAEIMRAVANYLKITETNP